MGNVLNRIAPSLHSSSGASSKIIAQSQAQSANDIYLLVQPPTSNQKNGRGILVDEAAKCFSSNNYEPLHDVIRKRLEKFLYNNGECQEIPIRDIVTKRNQERNEKHKQEESIFKRFFERRNRAKASSISANLTDGKTKKCCWNINKRGALGETALHICLLNNTKIHVKLAMEMIKVYPNLLHDIYLLDEYYGETILHMAIANESKEFVKFIVEEGKKINLNLQERCFGKFFSPKDQTYARFDVPGREEVGVPIETNYKGLVYWGEYSLSFAACSDQFDLVKLIMKEGADILAQDTNGNNVLHLMVIHKNVEMFNFCYNLAGNKKKNLLQAKNRQQLTPLTLSAKLAHKEMLDYILELKREVVWKFGDVTCAHYPLTNIDTIDPKNGQINNHSALNIIVNSDTNEHLSMLDGLLYQLLHEKWKEYGKVRFYQKGFFFIIYLALFITAVYLQPAAPRVTLGDNTSVIVDECYLLAASSHVQIIRFVLEIMVVLGAWIYLLLVFVDIYNEGILSFLLTTLNAPSKGSFHLACVLIISLIPCRFSCSLVAENVILTLAIFTCVPYLFFFCRGFKIVGPFIVAIYNMIKGDLLRFLLIYLVFLIGFSQAMYLVFRGTEHPLFSFPFLSILGMFFITLGEFTDLYEDFDSTSNPNAAKLLFVVYMILGTVLLINVLIAMFGNTFTKIADTRWEWQRQWAKIVLVIERSVSPKHRKLKQRKYSILDKEERWFVVRKFATKQSGT